MAWRTRARSNGGLVDGLLKEQVCSEWCADQMRKVDRGLFTTSDTPYDDSPQPIGFGQTISAPHMHAMCLDILRPVLDGKHDEEVRLLDVGSGSGYFVALLAACNKNSHVFGIELIPELVEMGKKNLSKCEWLEKDRVSIVNASAWKPIANGPFDAIHVGAAAERLPDSLMQCLKIGGLLLIPVGKQHETQYLTLIKRLNIDEFESKRLMAVQYVPLVDQK